MAGGSEPPPQQPQQPLEILCEEALKLDAHVRFRDPEVDGVINLEDRLSDEEVESGDVFELEGVNATSTLAIAECIADLLYERQLNANLERASFNKIRNTNRYAQTGRMLKQATKRKHAHPKEIPSTARLSASAANGAASGG